MIARTDTPYTGPESLKGKRLTYVLEASSGEAFARKLFGGQVPSSVRNTVYVPSKSHDIAVKQVAMGRADFAFVKNLAWEGLRTKFSDLHQVAADDGENPNNVFLVSKAVYAEYGKRLKAVFLGMGSDTDPAAKRILKILGVKSFIPTSYPDSYTHTARLVQDAGINPETHQFAE